jgi:hypothetical protein
MTMRRRRYARSAVALLIMSVVWFLAPAAHGARGKIIDPDDAVKKTGKTYGEWSAAWWRYALSLPMSDPDNPLFDSTGEGCRVNQEDDRVFFLAGVFASGAATRNACVVPAGKVLFFPLVNFIDLHIPGDGLDTPDAVWDDLISALGPVTNLAAAIDGVPVSDLDPATTPYRACVGEDAACPIDSFGVKLSDDNVFGVPEGAYSPAVAQGFYLMVSLPRGKHTLSFGGQAAVGKNTITQAITYELTVQ